MTIILSNEGSLIDFCYLMFAVQPVFVTVDVDTDQQMGLRVISGLELVKRAIGVRLPEQRAGLHKSFKQVYDTLTVKRPIVVFP